MSTQTASPLDFIVQQGRGTLWAAPQRFSEGQGYYYDPNDPGADIDSAITAAVQSAPDVATRTQNYQNVINKYFSGQSISSLVNQIMAARGWGGPGTGVRVNPDGTVSVNQDMGGDSFWKAPAAFAAAIGAGGLMGGAFGGLGAAGSGGTIGAADLGDVGAAVSSGGLGTAATTAGASTVGDFNLFDPSTWDMGIGSANTGLTNTAGITDTAGLTGTYTSPELTNFIDGVSPGETTVDAAGNLVGPSYGTQLWNQITNMFSGNSVPPGTQQLVQKFLSSGGSANALPSFLKALGLDPNGVLGSGISLAAREAPGLMALDYAKSQGDKTQSIIDQIAGNQGAVIKAATDPLQANIAAGYGDLLQSQGLRGIRGSSFGNTDIANYIARTGSALANAGANAAEGSLALQAQLTNQAQANKNALYGRAFDILGRGLSPSGFGNTLSLSA